MGLLFRDKDEAPWRRGGTEESSAWREASQLPDGDRDRRDLRDRREVRDRKIEPERRAPPVKTDREDGKGAE